MLKINTKLNYSLNITVLLLCALGVLFSVLRTYFTIDVMNSGVLPDIDDITYNYALHPWVTLMHAVSGTLFMITGPVQFIKKLRGNFPRVHRTSGYIFVISSLLIGISGITIAVLFPFGGIGETLVSILFGGLFLLSVCYGLFLAINRKYKLHMQWMMRAFSIGLAIVSIRFIGPIVQIFLPEDASADLIFTTAMLIGWLLHIAVTEIIIIRNQKNKVKPIFKPHLI